MLKKKVDGLEDYYYQWMNKYKDDADRRGELLKESVELFYTLYNHYVVNEEATMEMIGKIEEELADGKK